MAKYYKVITRFIFYCCKFLLPLHHNSTNPNKLQPPLQQPSSSLAPNTQKDNIGYRIC